MNLDNQSIGNPIVVEADAILPEEQPQAPYENAPATPEEDVVS